MAKPNERTPPNRGSAAFELYDGYQYPPGQDPMASKV
ncbi:hypothetical protein BREV_BREV_03494 [Brevundimonas mediterranea]|jgi:hypothetical protein|uniref:Uncharacterized protein n=1 Tax=Brevundimonas mediterranea TaxID=74329 RepID=A0A7Z8Y216_9CAUL|nr:hypothetical protein BREV_BREV_03494 [Brevundimonas mediterranea]